jgi:ketosteroid isomerase-like protein
MSNVDSAESTLRAANIELVRRMINAINREDMSALEAVLHEEAVLELAYCPEPFPALTSPRDAIIAFISSVPGWLEPENLHDVRVETYASNPNELVAEYKSSTRVKASGAPYNNEYVVRLSVRDGRIIRFAEYFDPIRLVTALGGTVELPHRTV